MLFFVFLFCLAMQYVGTLVSQLGIEPVLLALEAES